MRRSRREVRRVVVQREEEEGRHDDEASTSEEEDEDEEEELPEEEDEEGEGEDDEGEGVADARGTVGGAVGRVAGGVSQAVASRAVGGDGSGGGGSGGAKQQIKMRLKGAKPCKVCKATDHEAGFVGSVYVDCPNRPCYLCKQPGHTTATCPHRVAPGASAAGAGAGGSQEQRRRGAAIGGGRQFLERWSKGLVGALHSWQLMGCRARSSVCEVMPQRKHSLPNRVDAAVIGLHVRRINVLQFHPSRPGLILSADKRGHIGLWNFELERDTTLYDTVHNYLISALRVSPHDDTLAYSSSLDGTVSQVDLETGASHRLQDLNPDGWQGDLNSWRSFYSMDVHADHRAVITGDDIGRIHILDSRVKGAASSSSLLLAHADEGAGVQAAVEYLHTRRTKVVCVHCHPCDGNVFVSSGNDRAASIWDLRYLTPKQCLARFMHPRVVNSAYFSPRTGSKLLTTCQDNRIRIWDCVHSAAAAAAHEPSAVTTTTTPKGKQGSAGGGGGGGGGAMGGPPSRTVVHSHDFNRYLSAFRAEWDPKDVDERLIVCGRYISDDYNGAALHPIDLMDAATGALVAALVDPNLTTISPVNTLHPTLPILASGSSRSIYIWKHADVDDEEEEEAEREQNGHAADRPSTALALPRAAKGSAPRIYEMDAKVAKKKKAATKAVTVTVGRGKKPAETDKDEEEDEDEEEEEEEKGKSGSRGGKGARDSSVQGMGQRKPTRKRGLTGGGVRGAKGASGIADQEEGEDDDGEEEKPLANGNGAIVKGRRSKTSARPRTMSTSKAEGEEDEKDEEDGDEDDEGDEVWTSHKDKKR